MLINSSTEVDLCKFHMSLFHLWFASYKNFNGSRANTKVGWWQALLVYSRQQRKYVGEDCDVSCNGAIDRLQ